MIQTAKVTKKLGSGMAQVEVERQSACGGNCAGCGGCNSKDVITATAKNSISASVGDRVSLKTSTGKIMKIATVVYILPLITLLLGYGITAAMGASENLSIGVSILSFAVGVVAAIPVHRSVKSSGGVEFEIFEILS